MRVPLAIGWFRPAIVLPPERHRASAAPQIDAVLVHELGHLQRRDDVWNLVQQISQIFYWPHPLTWVAAGLIAEVREQACDNLCVHWAGGAQSYRTTLIAVAAGLVERGKPKETLMSASPVSMGMAMARSSKQGPTAPTGLDRAGTGAPRCQLSWTGRVLLQALLLFVTFAVGSIELGRASSELRSSAKRNPFLRTINHSQIQ